MGMYSSLSEFDRKTREGLREALSDGERFLGGIDGMDSVVPRRRTKLVLTDTRLIEFERGVVRQSATDYSRDTITTVTFDKGIVKRRLTISGSGFSREWLVHPKVGQNFVAALRDDRATAVFDEASRSTDSGDEPPDGGKTELEYTESGLRSRLQRMDDYEFEYFVADLWEQRGWSCEVSQASVDAGIDVVATKTHPYEEKKVIQAKRYSDTTTVGGPDVQQYASLKHQIRDADSVIIVTTSSFTSNAKDRASELNVKLVDGDDIVRMIEQLDVDDLLAGYFNFPTKESEENEKRSEPTTSNRDSSTGDGLTVQPQTRESDAVRNRLYEYLTTVTKHGSRPYILTLLASVSWVLVWVGAFTNGPPATIGVIALFAWGGLPLGIHLDTQSTGDYEDRRLRRWAYIGVALVPFVGLLSGWLYLRQRELQTDTEQVEIQFSDQSEVSFDTETTEQSSTATTETDDRS